MAGKTSKVTPETLARLRTLAEQAAAGVHVPLRDWNAACDPQTVIALLDEIDRLQGIVFAANWERVTEGS